MAYRVALVGAGNIGRVHARHWTAQPDAELVGIFDSGDCSRTEYAVPFYESFEALLQQAQPDIVAICTPTPAHTDYILQATAAGKAIFAEKPLARTLADCDAIVDAIERSGTPFMAGHVLRYFPNFAAAKQIVDAGGVGKPAAIRTARLAAFPGTGRSDNWYADYAQSGGVVLDMILHDFDWLRWCFGEVERVFAKGLVQNSAFAAGPLDYALVTLRFAGGAVAHVTGSWAHTGGFRTTFEIAGDGGMLDFDSDKAVPLSISTRSRAEGDAGGVAVPESPMAAHQDPYYLEQRAFLDALQQDIPPPVTVYDAREAVRIGLAALQSIETGKAVTL